jgi:radical SAM protein with 4Fe4S-binding SPASM domain
MPRRSSVPAATILKNAMKVATSPWIARRLAAIEAEKALFGLLTPNAPSGCARAIRQLSIRITDVCNLRCHTCGQWGDRGFLHGRPLKDLKRAEVRPQRYMDLLGDLARNGHRPTVYLWGGEPTLYAGWMDIVRRATELRMPAAIATNGTGIPEAARELVEAPMFLLQLSIDGHDAATHNAARPAAGGGDNHASVRRALDAVSACKRRLGRRLPLVAALCTVSDRNAPHLVRIYDAYRDQIDLFVFYLSWWIDAERAVEHERDFQRRFGFIPSLHRGWIGDWSVRDPEGLDDQMRALRRYSAPLHRPPVTFIPDIRGADSLCTYYTNHRAAFGYTRCMSIFHAVEIDSNGDMSPCRDYHDYVVGNVKDRTIAELWNHPAYRRFRSSLHTEGLMPVCTRCCGLMGY